MSPSKISQETIKSKSNLSTPSPASLVKPLAKRRIPSLKHPNDLVILYAGEDEQVFTVHQDFACHYSPVLNTAFNSQFEEGKTKNYRLKDTTPRALRLLNHWLYTQKLDIAWEASCLEKNEANTENVKAVIELWVLAEKLLISTLQNMALEELLRFRKVTNNLPIVCIPYIYGNTAVDSPLRRFIVDACAHLTTRGFKDHSKYFPQEFLIDLVTVMSGHMPAYMKMDIRPEEDSLHLYKVAED